LVDRSKRDRHADDWLLFPIPNVALDVNLYGVAATGDEVWVVGAGATIARWSGDASVTWSVSLHVASATLETAVGLQFVVD
jgi:hypothetical protein